MSSFLTTEMDSLVKRIAEEPNPKWLSAVTKWGNVSLFFVNNEALIQHLFILSLAVSRNNSNRDASWAEQLRLIRQVLRFEDYNYKTRKKENYLHSLSITQCGDIVEEKFIISQLLSSFSPCLSSSLSRLAYPALLLPASGEGEATVYLMWPWSGGKVRIPSCASGKHRPMQLFSVAAVCELIFSLSASASVFLHHPASPPQPPHHHLSRLIFCCSIWAHVHRHCVPLHDTPESFHLAEQLVSRRCGVPQGVAGKDNCYLAVHAQNGQTCRYGYRKMRWGRKQQELIWKIQTPTNAGRDAGNALLSSVLLLKWLFFFSRNARYYFHTSNQFRITCWSHWAYYFCNFHKLKDTFTTRVNNS